MTDSPKRDVLPDLLKALLILSVLLQHSDTALNIGLHISEDTWTNWLSASPFNMPLFMAICGYYFYYSAKKRTLWGLLKSKLVMILVPCLAWIMLGNCVEHFLSGEDMRWVPRLYKLWFLWSAMFCMLLGCVCHYGLPRVEGWVMAAFCGLLCLLPKDTDHLAYMFPFFSMGYMTCKYGLASKLKPWMGWTALAAYIALHCCITNATCVWYSHSYLFGGAGVFTHICINGYRLAIGLVGSIAFIFIVNGIHSAHYIPTAISKTKVWALIQRYITALGQYSLVVYASQAVFLELCTPHLMKTLAAHGLYNPLAIPFRIFQWVCIPLTAFIISLLCLAALRLAKTNRITRFLFIGKA